MKTHFTPEVIFELKQNEIFVFGSNLEGRHNGGAALIARKKFGAIKGQGVGLQGNCYAIPTMSSLDQIQPYVDEFVCFAKLNPDYSFLVTRIGCGIAGFVDAQIAPIFSGCLELENVILPKSFVDILTQYNG